MNSKKARAIRNLINYDGNKEASLVETDTKYYAVIDGVNGNHDVREEPIYERRTNEDRYLYRKLKTVYKKPSFDPEVRKQLIADLSSQNDDA